MIKRLLFHLLQFSVLCLVLTGAVVIYYKFAYASFIYSLGVSYEFVLSRILNFLAIALATYSFSYFSGLVKFTIEDNYFRLVNYFKELSKLLLIVVLVAFIEFLLFYKAQIGRLIYVYFFILYSLYYYIYMRLRTRGGSRKLLWMAAIPSEQILDRYLKKNNGFHVITTDQEREEAGLEPYVVYQDGHIDELTTEALIKSKLAGYTVMELEELVEKETGRIPLDFVNIHWFLENFEVADRSFFRLNRFTNILMSFFLLILLFPPGLLAAFIHKLFSSGPIFYIQQRQGLHGKPFGMIKFRTMVDKAEKNGAQFAGRHDSRITPIGKFMRRLRIDEIPQFINILKGDMSMVGPRPEREVFIETLSKEIPYYKLRLLVPPGLTGWAQVNGVYAGNNTDDHKMKLEYDLFYIKNRSIFMDSLILLRTISTMLQARGE
ncbi:MAG: sugar transferase [Acidobacteria bacterium]|jgi:lipopolysaccharide/colanic/teichoic acid biosynthesis glycosyltransferase|nr:sugar transferase [Acidobacteriota bacterium]